MSADDISDIVCPFPDGVRLTVRAKPGLSRAHDIKIVDIGNGKRAIEVSVSADAKEGKANRALIERLSEEIGVTKKKITIKTGETGRLKIVEIQGDAQALVRSVKALLAIS
ncbi:MAG: DUF167 family protein [Bdellovibrionales bacterium]|jgi:hypothetical protein